MCTLPKDTLELLNRTAVEAHGARVTRIDGNERTVLITTRDGTREHTLPPDFRRHSVRSLETLASLVVGSATDGESPGSIWLNPNEVVFLYDDADRRDHATLDLHATAVWTFVLASQPARLTPETFIRLLRTTLRDAVTPTDAEVFRNVLQRVTFTRRDEQTNDLSQKGREGLGLTVEKAVLGMEGLPERLDVTTTLYRELPELPEATISFDVAPDYDKKQFVLTPIGDAVELATTAAMAGLRMAIAAALSDAVSKNANPNGKKPLAGVKVGIFDGKP